MTKKKKILIIGDSIKRNTGYSTVCSNLIRQLSDYYEIAQLGLADVPVDPKLKLPIDYYTVLKDHRKCCNRGMLIDHYSVETSTNSHIVPNFNSTNVTEYCPRGINVPLDVFAQDSAFYTIQHYQPDIVMPINDVWALYSFNFLRNRKNFYFMPYLAVDSECFPIRIDTQKPGLPPIDTIQFLGGTNKTVVFTNWAKETINKTTRIVLDGKVADNIDVIPHGVDNGAFHPLDNKIELRKRFFGLEEGDGTFVIGCVQRNQPRKRMDAIFQTLRIFIDKYEKPGRRAVVHFHCAMKDNMGWDLPWLAQYYGVTDRCIFDDKLTPGMGVPTNVLNEIFNAYDVHLTLTNSEGWCTLPNTKILTDKGSIAIRDIKCGDNVISHTGSIRKVTKELRRKYSGDMINIQTIGNPNSLPLTPNHNILILRDDKEEWIRADELKIGDYACLPIYNGTSNDSFKLHILDMIDENKKHTIIQEDDRYYKKVKNRTGYHNYKNPRCKGIDEYITFDQKLSYVIGAYLAEGSTNKSGIVFSINASKDDNIRRNVYDYFSNYNPTSSIMERNRENLNIYSSICSDIYEIFGIGANNKHIPSNIFSKIYSNEKLSKSLLNGVFEGDGYFNEEKSWLVYTSVSEKLIDQIRLLLLRCGIFSKKYHSNRGEYNLYIQGKKNIDNCSTFIDKCSKWNLNRSLTTQKYLNSKIWFKITDISEFNYDGVVYNISVEKDESYIAEGVVVHNCLPILETMAAGVPNIITDYSAHGDWATGVALKVRLSAKIHEIKTNHIKGIADIEHAAKQLSLLYDSDKMLREYQRKSLVLAEELDWSNVCSKWKDLIDGIDVSHFKDDRYDISLIKPETIQDIPSDPVNTEFELVEV